MKRLLFIFCVFSYAAIAQVPNWSWAKSAGGNFDVYGCAVSSDAYGNVFAVGGYTGPVTFGSFSLGNSTPVDLYFVKYDLTGNVLWAKKIVNGGTYGVAVSVDAQGNGYITGEYSGTITFGSITLPPGPGSGLTVFVVKYDPLGNVLWARSACGTVYGNDYGLSIDASAEENIYVTGIYETPSIIFGNDTVASGASAGGTYLTRYDSAGNVLWSRGNTGSYFSKTWGNRVKSDLYGNIYVTGSFNDTITFGGYILMSAGVQDLFIVKYDSVGNVMWAKNAGGPYNESGQSVSTDPSGNIYVTGNFESDTLDLNGAKIGNDSAGASDVFIAKFDAAGTIQWLRKASFNKESDLAHQASTDAMGITYVCGANRIDTTSLANYFLSGYDNSGNLVWTQTGTSAYNNMIGLCTDINGNGFVTGNLGNTLTFGATTISNGTGGVDMYLAKFDRQVISGNCSAYFNLFPDINPHSYIVSNMSLGAAAYNWNWGDGSPADTGATPSHVYAQAGFYTICLSITGPMACSGTYCYPFNLQKNSNSMIYVNVLPGAVGMQVFDSDNLSIFPNPMSDNITVSSGKEAGFITISNSLGQIVYKTETKSFNSQIDISQFPRGVYIVRALGKSYRLVKQ